jgi:hypothetical protein
LAWPFSGEVQSSSHKLGIDSRRLKITRTHKRDHDYRHPVVKPLAQDAPKAFAHLPFDPISHDRVADPSRDGNPEPLARTLGGFVFARMIARIVDFARIEDEVLCLQPDSAALKAKKLRASMQPVGRSEAMQAVPRGTGFSLCGFHTQPSQGVGQPGCLRGIVGVRRLRPLARRRFRTARPPGEAIRARNPWVRLRRRLCGW